jgi:hypothetical protein
VWSGGDRGVVRRERGVWSGGREGCGTNEEH